MRRLRLWVGLSVLLGACGEGGGADDAAPDAAADAGAGGAEISLRTYYSPLFDEAQPADVDQALVQDGDGPWVPMTGTGSSFTARVVGPRYGVATLCAEQGIAGLYVIWVQQRTTAEATDLRSLGCRSPSTIEVTGQAVGLAADVSATVTASTDRLVSTIPGEPYSFRLPAGPTELASITVPFSPATPRLIARTALLDLSSDTTVNVDFAAAAPLVATPLAPPTATGGGSATTFLVTPAGRLLLYRTLSRQQTMEFVAFPPALSRADDTYEASLRWFEPLTDGTYQTWQTKQSGTGPFSPQLAPGWRVPVPALTSGPNKRTVHPLVAEGAGANVPVSTVLLSAVGSSATDELALVVWGVELSQQWLSSSGAPSYTLPDLSGAPGWSSQYEFSDYGGISWETSRVEPDATPSETRSAGREGGLGEYCGDGIVNGPETCDTAGPSATCDFDCTPVQCGDGMISGTEQCDPPQTGTCTEQCQLPNP